MGGVVKKISKGIRSIGRAVKRTVSKTWKIVKTGAEGAYNAVKNMFDPPKLEAPDPAAQAAPPPEQAKPEMEMAENISRRKRKRRNGLRIDLNTGGPPTGTGVNLPVG